MKALTANFFLCRVRYDKIAEDGVQRKTTENYVVAADNFADAERKITDETAMYASGEFDVVEIDRAKFGEVVLTDGKDDDKWYKEKIAYLDVDDRGKEKRTYANYLVQASSLEGARNNMVELQKGSMMDYSIVSVAETTILDVFLQDKNK